MNQYFLKNLLLAEHLKKICLACLHRGFLQFCLAMKTCSWSLPSTAHKSVIFLIKEHIVYLDQEIEKIRK